jgi:hypothetical protein
MHVTSDAVDELLVMASAMVAPAAVFAAAVHHSRKKRERRYQRTIRFATPCERVPVTSVHDTLGPRIFRRAFRMTLDSFWRLYSILLPHIQTAMDRRRDYQCKGGREGGNYSLPLIPNGPISPSIRLGAAICYFAGGSPYDIICVFGIAYTEVLSSLWIVVEAINNCPQFEISYPDLLEEQRKIAAGFEAASTPGIRHCAGAIDGILIWMLKPSLTEARRTGVDQKKYLCGCKHKFGLNCQVVADCRGRIIDISIKYGGASSDCLAFEASELHTQLENGLMKKDGDNERFVLFSDNAYLNTSYMATPFTNVAGDPNCAAEDNYNFYHSQLRIRVECAFGMLVQRWGLLWMAIPRNIGVSKVVALVVALAKLHNFCIGESNVHERLPPRMYHRDRYHIMNVNGGYVSLSNDDPQQNTLVPTELLHAGEHFDDVPCNVRRSRSRQSRGSELPRTVLFEMIADGHWQRPTRLGTNRGR